VHAAAPDHWQRRCRVHWQHAPAMHAGEHWQLLLRLRRPRAAANPGRSLPVLQLLRQGVHADAEVIQSPLDRRTAAAAPGIDPWRERLATAIAADIAERDAAALAVALAVGETSRVSGQQWQAFDAAGITHLVAISGLHVTLFAVLVAAAGRRLWRVCRPLWRWRRDSVAATLGTAAALGYALLAGFSVPTRRTFIMYATWQLLRVAARPTAAAPPLLVALCAVLLFDPLAILGAGFWLSFVAVAVLMHATPPATESLFDWRALWGAQWRVAVGLLPVCVAVFGSVSIAGLGVNFLAIPLFSLVLVPLVLAASACLLWWPAAAQLLLQVFAAVHGWTWPWLLRVSDSDLALWHLPAPWWWVLPAGLATLLLLYPWRWSLRATAALALLPALWPLRPMLLSGEFRLTALDVGQGTAVILQTRAHALLYDNGETWGSGGTQSRGTLLPALRALGIRRLDAVILPRLDNDRAAGFVALRAAVPVLDQWTGATVLPPEFQPCQAGNRWRWDGVALDLLDGGTCTLQVRSTVGSALLASELQSTDATALRAAAASRSDWLLVPRNGYASGDAPELRAALGARVAVVSQTAARAKLQTVRRSIEAWQTAGARVLVTGLDGAITAEFGPRGLRLTTGNAAAECSPVSCAACGKSCALAGQ
jgi:competence protein ComEC